MTIPPVTAPYLASVAILAAAGVAKGVRPEPTARALAIAGIHAGRTAVRAGAVGEVALGLTAVFLPGAATASAVAATYAAFAAFVLVALRRDWPLGSCGCFGRPDNSPTAAHAVLDAGASATAAWWAAVWPSRGGFGHLARTFSRQPWHGSALLVVTAVLAGMAYAVWTNPLTAARAEARR